MPALWSWHIKAAVASMNSIKWFSNNRCYSKRWSSNACRSLRAELWPRSPLERVSSPQRTRSVDITTKRRRSRKISSRNSWICSRFWPISLDWKGPFSVDSISFLFWLIEPTMKWIFVYPNTFSLNIIGPFVRRIITARPLWIRRMPHIQEPKRRWCSNKALLCSITYVWNQAKRSNRWDPAFYKR